MVKTSRPITVIHDRQPYRVQVKYQADRSYLSRLLDTCAAMWGPGQLVVLRKHEFAWLPDTGGQDHAR